jgi:hypothetical protein
LSWWIDRANDKATGRPAEVLGIRAEAICSTAVWRRFLSGSGAALFALDALKDFLAMDSHILRRVDPYADLVALDTEHRNTHGVTDHQGFADSARQNQHVSFAPLGPLLFASS